LTLRFMNEKRTAKPRLVVVRAEPEDEPAEARPKPVTKTKKAG
jgi:hypothetical protein